MRLIVFILFSLSFCSIKLSASPISAVVAADVLNDYQQYLAGRSPESISFYGGKGTRRDVVETVLFVQALRLGGCQQSIEIAASRGYDRILKELKVGTYTASAALNWQSDAEAMSDSFWITEPIIQDGEFAVGLFTTPDNQKALAAKNLSDLRQMSAITGESWLPDQKVLQELGIKTVHKTNYWIQQAYMLRAHRADFVLSAFQSTPNLHIVVDGIELVPIPNMRVLIRGNRVWVVSKRVENSEAIFHCLQQGIKQLKAESRIKRAFQETGFYDTRVEAWPVLNPMSQTQ